MEGLSFIAVPVELRYDASFSAPHLRIEGTPYVDYCVNGNVVHKIELESSIEFPIVLLFKGDSMTYSDMFNSKFKVTVSLVDEE